MNHEFWITFALYVFTKAETKTFRVGALNLLVGPTLHAAAKTVDYSSWTSNLNHPQQTTIPLVLGRNQWQIEAHDLVRCQKLPTFGWEGGILTKRKKKKHPRPRFHAYSLPNLYFLITGMCGPLCRGLVHSSSTSSRAAISAPSGNHSPSPSRLYSDQPSATVVVLSTCSSCALSSGGQTLSPHNSFSYSSNTLQPLISYNHVYGRD